MKINKINYLVSVKSKQESTLACKSGVDFIDIKDPSKGALGVAKIETVTEIVKNVKKIGFSGLISTTFEDTKSRKSDAEREVFFKYLLSGIDLLKIGITNSHLSCENFFNYFNKSLIEEIKKNTKIKEKKFLVPVLLMSKNFDFSVLSKILTSHIFDLYYGLMIDTNIKDNGSLFDLFTKKEIIEIKKLCVEKKLNFGIAGSLKSSDISLVKEINPTWVGFRGGVCKKGRTGELCTKKIIAIKLAIS